jgi:hypothetical protein
MSLILVTAANGPYMVRIAPYLHTIAQHGQAFDRRVLVSVGCAVQMPDELGGIDTIPLPASLALGHTGNFCIQQGCFLDVLGATDDDVIVFTDGDVLMQRTPTVDELAWMRAIPPDTIALAWNAGPGDTLYHEAERIALAPGGRAMFTDWLHYPVYNVGVIICRASTYAAIYACYMEQWPEFSPHTPHYAANQFLMCAAIAQLGLPVWTMHPTVHSHGCFGLPTWATASDDGSLMVAGTPVLFRHHWNC